MGLSHNKICLRLTCRLSAELHRYFPLLSLIHWKLPRHLMWLCNNLHLINCDWFQVEKLVFIAPSLDHVIFCTIEEDSVAVIAVTGHPRELHRALCDVVNPQVVRCHHHILSHKKGCTGVRPTGRGL